MSTYSRTRTTATLTVLSAVIVGAVALLSPSTVRALWPFASAQAADEDAPVLHDGSMRLLAAALHSDPNPSKNDGELSIRDGSALLASGAPMGDLVLEQDVQSAPSARSGSISVYTVKDGDSISSIADHFGVSVNTILWANDLTVRSTIRPGMILNILPVSGIQHKVAKGETLSTIASDYDASAGEIATFNGLDAGATVVVGTTLIIPGGRELSVPTSAAKSKSTTTTKTTTTKTSGKTTTTKTTTVTAKSDLGTAATGGYFTNPVPGAILTQGIHGNNSVDLSAPSGTPIHAAAGGTVIISKGDGAWNGGYGSYVVVSHANGTQTLYSHMSKDIAMVGESVSSGQIIGYVGDTGEATGNHLHFEVRGGKNPFGTSCSLMKRCY